MSSNRRGNRALPPCPDSRRRTSSVPAARWRCAWCAATMRPTVLVACGSPARTAAPQPPYPSRRRGDASEPASGWRSAPSRSGRSRIAKAVVRSAATGRREMSAAARPTSAIPSSTSGSTLETSSEASCSRVARAVVNHPRRVSSCASSSRPFRFVTALIGDVAVVARGRTASPRVETGVQADGDHRSSLHYCSHRHTRHAGQRNLPHRAHSLLVILQSGTRPAPPPRT